MTIKFNDMEGKSTNYQERFVQIGHGVLFPQRSAQGKQPQYKGTITYFEDQGEGIKIPIAGWTRTNIHGDYITISATVKEQKVAGIKQDLETLNQFIEQGIFPDEDRI